MLNKLLGKKKIVIIALVTLLVVCIGIVIFVTSKSDKNDKLNSDIKTEQDVNKETDKDNNGSGLEVLEPDAENKDYVSDASGTWDDETTENTQQTDTSDNADNAGNANQTDNEENENDNNSPNDTEEEDEDILEDDITWGDIY